MQISCADWNKEKLVLNLTCLLWVSLEAGNGELCTWEATRQWCSYRKPVLTLWLGNIGGQLPLPETPREDAKLHLHRPQGSEELQTVNISMCTAVLVCMPWLNLSCRAGGLPGVFQGAGPPVTQMRKPTGAHHKSFPAHTHSFPSKDALKEVNVCPGPCLTRSSDSQLQVS